MAYADAGYYKNTYKGNIIPDDVLEDELEKASYDLDAMTYTRIAAIDINVFTEFQQDRIRRAVCSQADFKYQYGPYLEMPVSGYSAGSISLSFKPIEAGGIKTSSGVINLLKATGLMDRRL